LKLKLSNLASLAEIVAAVAVVISLIYVGIQVNDSAAAVKSAAANDANVALQSWYFEIGSSPESSDSYFRTMMSAEPTSDEEEFRFLMMTHALFLGIQNSFLLAEEATIDQELRRAMGAAINGTRTIPGIQRFWRQRKQYFHADFVEWVDREAQNYTPTMDIYELRENN